ncbi:MAG: hypothetical protein KIS66_08520 [Fimbriimonadaceae bacterium]|nr:hypothetical protein [Fimbriimonadaceae bacterium]
MEILRRILLAVGVYGGLWLIAWAPPYLYSAEAVDWEAARERKIGRHEDAIRTMSGLVPEEDLKGVDLAQNARGDLAAFIASETKGHTDEVPSEMWRGVFAGLAATADGNPPSEAWRARVGRYVGGDTLFFTPEEPPFDRLAKTFTGDVAFRYLEIRDGAAVQHVAVTKRGRQDVVNYAPAAMAYPYRLFGLIALAAGIALYALLPWPKVARESFRYSRVTAGTVPDGMAAVAGGMFFVLPLLITNANGYGDGPFAEGWIWVTAALWLLTAILASMWFFSARYTATSLEPLAEGLRLRTLRDDLLVPYDEIGAVGARRVDNPKLSKFLIWASVLTGSWRSLGSALLASRAEFGLSLRLKDGRLWVFPTRTTLGAAPLVGRLSGMGVPIEQTAYDVLGVDPGDPALTGDFPPLGRGFGAAFALVVLLVPVAVLATFNRPLPPLSTPDSPLPTALYKSSKPKPWVPTRELMQRENKIMAEMGVINKRMKELETLVRSDDPTVRAKAAKESDECTNRMLELSAEFDKVRKEAGAPD